MNNSLIIVNFFTKFRIFGKFLICFRKFDWKSDTRHYFLEFGVKSGKIFIKNSQKKCKIRIFCDWISEFSLIQSQKILAIFDEKIEIRERCKGVHCVDLGESFPTSSDARVILVVRWRVARYWRGVLWVCTLLLRLFVQIFIFQSLPMSLFSIFFSNR